MTHIRTRPELFSYLERNSPSETIRRAFIEGTACNLGGYSKLPASQVGGYIVAVTSRSARVYYVCLAQHTNRPWTYYEVTKEQVQEAELKHFIAGVSRLCIGDKCRTNYI